MLSVLIVATALVVRCLTPVEGTVACALKPGESLVAAYSAEFEPIWRHAVPSTIVDRASAAQSGKVTGLGASDRLVLAVADENASFDATRPVRGEPTAFPYSPEIVREYGRLTGRDYVRDMMVVVAPKLGSQWARAIAVTDLYETLFALAGERTESRVFGNGTAGEVLVVVSRPRSWCWLDRCFGDDGTAYAERLAEKGHRVTLLDAGDLPKLSADADGFVVGPDGRRFPTMVLRHLANRDGARYRRTFGTRALKTKVYGTDVPVLYGVELTWSDPDL